MADVNHVILIGRLTRDAELKYTAGGLPISNFSIALNRRRKNGEQWVDEAHFFDVTLFGRSAESLKPYLTKGKQIAVDGELRQDRWEQDGQSRSKVYVAANNVQLLGGNTNGGSGPSAGGYSRNTTTQQQNSYQPQNQQQNQSQYGANQNTGYNQQNSYDAGSAYGGNDAGFTEDIPF